MTPEEQKEIIHLFKNKPHVVILGAGASVAALPAGSANGRKLPLMPNFIDVVGLSKLLQRHDIKFEKNENFEVLYSRISADPQYATAVSEIEEHVRKYFASLRLPEHPTIYDKLVLSLRKKDVIATFNWDPLLYQAAERNHHVAQMPRIFYLHGNVAIGYCEKHRKKGPLTVECPQCFEPFTPSRLMYPIENKNYLSDPFLSAEWESLKFYMKRAYILTIFGYGAPKSDVEAIRLLKEGWGDAINRKLEQTELIDIRDPDELREVWEPFIHTHHFEIHSLFEDSWFARHPRRTTDAVWEQYMECQFLSSNKMPETESINELHEWTKHLIQEEATEP